jgi:hypothetical protein
MITVRVEPGHYQPGMSAAAVADALEASRASS